MLRNILPMFGRGAAPFDPLNLPSLALWLDASDSTTITLTSSKVSEWRDKSGNANHAAQGTDANRYVVSAANQNGRDVIANSGSTGRMTLTNNIVLPTGGYYAFIACANATGSVGSIFLSGASSRYLFDLEGFGGGGVFHSISDGDLSLIIGWPAIDGSAHVHGFDVTASSSRMHYDGAVTTETKFGGMTLTSLTDYGSGYYLQGRIFEVIVGTAALTSGQAASISAYLKAKWGTP